MPYHGHAVWTRARRMDSATPPSVYQVHLCGSIAEGTTRLGVGRTVQSYEPRSNLRYGPRCLGWSSVTVAPVFCRFRSQRAHGPLKKNFAPPRYCGSMTIEVSRV